MVVIQVFFSMRPFQVRADANFKKGGLKLYPATESVAKVHANKPDHTGVTLKYNNNPFAVYPPAMPKTHDVSTWDPTQIIAAFWWVGSTSNLDDANMGLSSAKRDEVTFPILVNTKPFKKGDLLLKLDAKSDQAESGTSAKKAKRV